MDRPEWIAVHPHSGEVYVRAHRQQPARPPGQPAADAANPRDATSSAASCAGARTGATPAAPASPGIISCWPATRPADAGARYPSADADAFGSPDGLHFDSGGLLWIQTDMAAAIGKGERAGQQPDAVRRSGKRTHQAFPGRPAGCEVTGCVVTPDRRSLFVNIQHPGEPTAAAPAPGPTCRSARPRSATVVVRRRDGGIVGT